MVTDHRRRLLAAVGPAALVMLAAGCQGTRLGGPTGEPILSAVVLPDQPDAIEVEFSGCESDPEVEVAESDTTVEVTLVRSDGGCDPVFEMTIELDAPLGNRTLIDGATGDEVEVGNRHSP